MKTSQIIGIIVGVSGTGICARCDTRTALLVELLLVSLNPNMKTEGAVGQSWSLELRLSLWRGQALDEFLLG